MARIFTKDLGTTIPNRKDTSQWVELGLCTDFNLETGTSLILLEWKLQTLKMYQMKLQSVLSLQQHMQYLQRRKFLIKKWYRLFTKLECSISEWFPHSGYEHCGVTEFELYDERCHEDKSEFAQVELLDTGEEK